MSNKELLEDIISSANIDLCQQNPALGIEPVKVEYRWGDTDKVDIKKFSVQVYYLERIIFSEHWLKKINNNESNAIIEEVVFARIIKAIFLMGLTYGNIILNERQ
jgi:hypothetical protein